MQRDPKEGLLLIYPISAHSQPKTTAQGTNGEPGKQPLFDDRSRHGATVIGIAASFPHSDSEAATGGYVVGSAGPAPL